MSLTLGGVQFAIDDLPAFINFGGEQDVAVRKFPGGGLDLQPLGAFDDPIKFEGVFWFDGALAKAEALDAVRRAGNPVMLSVSTINRLVLVTKFTYDYQNDYYIPYTIELQPVVGYGLGASANGAVAQGSGTSVSTTTPGSTTGTVSAAAVAAVQPQIVHVVAAGDTLWGLAVQYYGSGSQWALIAQANNISDPKALQPGQKIIIPSQSKGLVV